MARKFFIKGVSFYVANYHPRNNEFENGLKYQLMVGINDSRYDAMYHSTGVYGSTIKELRNYAIENIIMWL